MVNKKNPYLMGLWATPYLAEAAVAITNDFLMAIMFMLFTLGILGVYVTQFPIFPTLFQYEILHKTAISSFLGLCLAMLLGLVIAVGSDIEGTAPI